jgi:cytoplasmic iron level regulating protein YaaA (DUF328/UPF0246 family)
MKILLSPSETKIEGGKLPPVNQNSFFLKELYPKREQIISQYNKYVSSLDIDSLSNWFGLKKKEEAQKLKQGIADFHTMKALERYTGVAFSAIDYNGLDSASQNYIDKNMVLFSNLFGPILAKDLIPDYKLKQGAKIPNLNIESFYKKEFTKPLDEFVGEEVIDLRAGFHEKQYKPTSAKTVKIKFLKDGKVVSHWSKHYRGIIVRELALNKVKCLEDFFKLKIDNLEIADTETKKNIELVTMVVK